MANGDCWARSDATHDQLGVEKFKSRFCIGIFVHKVKIILGLGQSYLHADARQQKLQDVADVGV